LSTVAFFFACVGAFADCECAAFASFVEGYSVDCVMLTFRTVSVYFFRNVHVIHYQLPNKETHLLIYFITYMPKKMVIQTLDKYIQTVER
jgi:hypothetical protein